MKYPNDPEYNKDFYGDNDINGLTIDQLIHNLEIAKVVVGGNCMCMMSFDGGAGYEAIKTVHAENFHDNLMITLSCQTAEEAEKYKSLCIYGDSINN